MSRYRQGEMKPIRTGRAARTRVGSTRSVTRLRAVLTSTAARVNATVTTAAQYLADTLGADQEFIRRFSSPFGKAAKKACLELFGAAPALAGLDVRGGRLVRVCAYTREQLAALEAGARAYTRTADLIGA